MNQLDPILFITIYTMIIMLSCFKVYEANRSKAYHYS